MGQLAQIQKPSAIEQNAQNVSEQWASLEQLLGQAWRLVLRAPAELEASKAVIHEHHAALPTEPNGSIATKTLAPGHAAVLTRWVDAWSSCLDPGSVWSGHTRTWLSMRGLVLKLSADKGNGPLHSRRPVCIGWPGLVEGLEPLPESCAAQSQPASTGGTLNDGASILVATVSTIQQLPQPHRAISAACASYRISLHVLIHLSVCRSCQIQEALHGLTYAQLREPLLQILIGDLSIGRREFVQACEGCAGVPATFGEIERPAIYRWYGLFGISTAFGGGVAMRESSTNQLARVRRWLQLMQLEWRPSGETVANATTKEDEERGEVLLWGWTWASSQRGRHGAWMDA